ncbi:MAG: tetratricopeptide repeat protein [Pseudomonadota bacterium]
MPTPKPRLKPLSALVALAILAGGGTAAHSFDPTKTFKADDDPLVILRFGYNALKKGNMDDAIGAFKFGAQKNDLASQWKLAHMMQTGAGGKQDDFAAYELYTLIANRFADEMPARNEIGYVSNALVALGRYELRGIKGTAVRANPRRAEDYFYRAAALFHDPNAQYELGRLYRSKALGTRQPMSAARWYGLAARKGHIVAQAELGEMLFYGDGVERRPVHGLLLMTRAVASDPNQTSKSVRRIHDKAFSKATEHERNAVESLWSSRQKN